MAFGKISIGRINKENEAARRVSSVTRRTSVESLFRTELRASDSLVINGSPASAQCRQLLRVRLEQLFGDSEIADRPVIVIGENLPMEFVDELEDVTLYQGAEAGSENEVYLIDQTHRFYDPFLGMSSTRIEEIIVQTAKLHQREVSEEEKNLFQGVCGLLMSQGFELSLYNIMKLYGVNQNENAQTSIARLQKLLQGGGYEAEAYLLNRDPLYFSRMQTTISHIYQTCQSLFEESGKGISILEKTREAARQGKTMPFFCFNITDGIREEFLEYLAGELKEVSRTHRPVILLHGIKISVNSEGGGSFFRYLKDSSGVSLNLVAQDCPSIFPDPQDDLPEMIGNYGFVMLLLNSGLNSEILAKNLGTYQHKIVSGHQEEQREWLGIFPHGVGKGIGEHEESWAVIRQENISLLGPEQCYLYRSRENRVTYYKKIVYD